MIRTGKISSYNNDNYTARVYFADLDMVSGELPILESCTLPLYVDEYVVCIYTEAKAGIILGRLHEKEDGD